MRVQTPSSGISFRCHILGEVQGRAKHPCGNSDRRCSRSQKTPADSQQIHMNFTHSSQKKGRTCGIPCQAGNFNSPLALNQLTTVFVKGRTMSALGTTDTDQTDWTEPTSTTCTVRHFSEFQFAASAPFEEVDFLTWSSRQKDAENILEYDE